MARAVVLALAAILVASAPHGCRSALNVGTHASQDLVRGMRESIFVETAHLAERRAEKCSSLDGPSCIAALLGKHFGAGATPVLDSPGVVPERLLHDLGVAGATDLDFATPEYSVLDAYHRQQKAIAGKLALPLLTGPEGGDLLRRARSSTASGILHFQGLLPDSRLPLTFSRGLPHNVTATWDGRWLMRGCGSTAAVRGAAGALGAPPVLALPAPDDQDGGSDGLAGLSPLGVAAEAIHLGGAGIAPRGGQEVSVTAELAGSVGYIRFSQPVIVRSLFARWPGPGGDAQAVVGGRLGLESIWTSHLDPAQLREGSHGVGGGWLDVAGGGALRPVDEIALVAAAGLEVGALEVVAQSGAEDEDHLVLVLAPVAGQDASQREAGQDDGLDAPAAAKPRFKLSLQRVTSVASPYIVSLQEAVDRNLRLYASPQAPAAGIPAPTDHVSGLHTTHSPPMAVDEANATWASALGANQAIFEHSALLPLMSSQWTLAVAAAAAGSGQTVDRVEIVTKAARALVESLGVYSDGLPGDLKRELQREEDAIVDALLHWVKAGGGWHRSTPSVLPRTGSEEALARYVEAKRRQTKLDLLTAAYLHSSAAARGRSAPGGASKLQPQSTGAAPKRRKRA
eukprot:CAMPEP_0203879640 /NCGR_PEP_ID=MMETSP0359-20131031/24067_1 /ASSEMBLY_ACC=CAM_ASM_000338 /TAXON_ID=268821 /ORGANISM="Scrippsiella Hangoei, Strain SHTV-5" /LENGTH=626 /DNA_ID=CAMNT_0050799097 /DNA_START=157 /DNA_END=2037 /DNA_ORIENTATION=+